MDAARVRLMLDLLTPTGSLDRAREFARTLRRCAGDPGTLLVVGTPGFEPWHFTAHLSDEAHYAGLPELDPTLVRWQVPVGAPAHLAISLERLAAARRGETLLIVTDEQAPAPLLERASDAKRVGATILAMNAGDPELSTLAHDMLAAAAGVSPADGLSFDLTQHVVSVAAAARLRSGADRARDRLARLLDRISGPPLHR